MRMSCTTFVAWIGNINYLIISESALNATPNGDVESALDWINSHQDDTAEQRDETTITAEQANLKCDDCGKLFSSKEAAEFHAFKSGHEAFSETHEALPQLTEEEKKQKIAELKEKLAEKRMEKARLESEESKQAELIRRKSAHTAALAKRELEEKELKKAAEQMRKDKEEEKRIRDRIRAEMEAERQARKRSLEPEKSVMTPAVPISTEATLTDSVRLQIRTPSGPLKFTFKSEEPFSTLVDALSLTCPIKPSNVFAIPHPRKVIAPADFSKSFAELGLCPSATLILE